MTAPAIFMRVDASSRTGGGHLSRCLALAEAFAERTCVVRFICRDIDDAYAHLIARRGYGFDVLDSVALQTAEQGEESRIRDDATASMAVLSSFGPAKKILIVDHYLLDSRWEMSLDAHVDCLFVIDDLADRDHACQILLDQTFQGGAARYDGLVPADCKLLLGSEYALLRPAFARLRKTRRLAHEPAAGFVVHVFFGSEDGRGNTHRFCRILLTIDRIREVRAAVSRQYRHPEALEQLQSLHASRFNWCVPDDGMAEHMAHCDVAIGAPGQATWERACLGLPAAYLATSGTQVPVLEHLDAVGFCTFLGVDHQISDEVFRSAVVRFLEDASQLRQLQRRSMQAVDGLGAARAADAALAWTQS